MRFIIMRKADRDTEAGVMPSEALIAAMASYNEALAKAGVLLDGMGLQPTAKGALVRFEGGKPTVTDGPFAESKEVVAGFTVIRAGSLAEALDWARRWPVLDGDGHVELEVRQVYELEDFGDSAELERHARLRDELGVG
jgi:hypothetical protein